MTQLDSAVEGEHVGSEVVAVFYVSIYGSIIVESAALSSMTRHVICAYFLAWFTPSDGAKKDINKVPIHVCFAGGIFHDENSDSEIAFRYAVERVNMHEKSFQLEPLIYHVSPTDSFKAQRIGD